jgi:hypothetical protein
MGCKLELEYCTRSCGCNNCVYNDRPILTTISKENEEENQRKAAIRRKIKADRRKRFIENALPKAVVPLIGNTEGCGFFIQNYFVTAGHCLENGPIAFAIDGEVFKFSKEDAIVYKTIDKNSDAIQTGDIAIFKFNKYKCCLQRGDLYNLLDKHRPYILPHYVHTVTNHGNNSSIFQNNTEKWELAVDRFSYSASIIHKVEGSNSYVSYFFEAYTDAIISEGCSGSPLIDCNGKVVGVLVGCNNPNKPNEILFSEFTSYSYLHDLD